MPKETLQREEASLDEILAQPVQSVAHEYRVVRFRRHARGLILPALVFIGTAGVVPYLWGSFPEPWQNIAVPVVAGAVLLLLVLGPFFSWLARSTTVSTRRIIARSGVFTRHRSEVSFQQVREMKLKRGPIQRMYQSGDVVLVLTSGDTFIIRHVPRVKIIAAAAQELIEWHVASQRFAGYYPPQIHER